MDIMAALDEMRSFNARYVGILNVDVLNVMMVNMRMDKERYVSVLCC